jgi:hypothetical protein
MASAACSGLMRLRRNLGWVSSSAWAAGSSSMLCLIMSVLIIAK